MFQSTLRRPLALVPLWLLVWSALPAPAPAAPPDWAQVLGPAQGKPPGAREKVVWMDDLGKAMQIARDEGRPLFVTLRCLPCKQCSAFDKDVLEGGPELDPLLRQFVTVRLISAKGVDLRLLPMLTYQDMDLSWWGYFLSPEGRVYGVFGGRDEVSDETRISKAALVNTLGRVLAHHADPRRPAWEGDAGVDGPLPDLTGPARTPPQLPGYASWGKDKKFDKRTAEAGCLHCHQVAEVLRQPALDARTFDKERDLQLWPLPENVGLGVDRDHGLLVTAVVADSPAGKAGLKTGDVLAEAGGRRLFGQADFRGALHRGPAAAGTIDLHVLRGGQVVAAQLPLPDGWRKTVLDWRTSVAQGNIGAEPGFWPIKASAADRKTLGVGEGAMLVRAYVPRGAAKDAGLAANAAVVAVDGRRPDLAGRAFLVWFRLHHDPGDPVKLSVSDGQGREREIGYQAGR